MDVTAHTIRAFHAARAAAHNLHAQYDSTELTKPARTAARRKLDDQLREQVDPQGLLPPAERERRTEHARRTHFQRLAYRSDRRPHGVAPMASPTLSAVPVDRGPRPVGFVEIYPQMASMALLTGAEMDLVNWAFLRGVARDGGGHDWLLRRDAFDTIKMFRGLRDRSTREALQRGSSHGYWTTGRERGTERIRLSSAALVCTTLGITRLGLAHLIPADLFQRRTQGRQQLCACRFEIPSHAGEFKRFPISRNHRGPDSALAQHAAPLRQLGRDHPRAGVLRLTPPRRRRSRGRSHGWFVAQGRQFRRLPDLRMPTDHHLGSKSAAVHINKELQAEPADDLCGCQSVHMCVCKRRADLAAGSNDPARLADVFVRGHDLESAVASFAAQCTYCRQGTTCTHRGWLARCWGEGRRKPALLVFFFRLLRWIALSAWPCTSSRSPVTAGEPLLVETVGAGA